MQVFFFNANSLGSFCRFIRMLGVRERKISIHDNRIRLPRWNENKTRNKKTYTAKSGGVVMLVVSADGCLIVGSIGCISALKLNKKKIDFKACCKTSSKTKIKEVEENVETGTYGADQRQMKSPITNCTRIRRNGSTIIINATEQV